MSATQIREALERRARELCGPLPGGLDAHTYVPEHVVPEKCRPKATRRAPGPGRRPDPPADDSGAGPSQTVAERQEAAKLARMRRSNPAPKELDFPNTKRKVELYKLAKYSLDAMPFIAYMHSRFDAPVNVTRFPDPDARFDFLAEAYGRKNPDAYNFVGHVEIKRLIASLALKSDYT